MRTDYVLSIEPYGNTHAVFLCIPGAVFVLFEAYAAMPAKDQWQACENVRGYIALAAKSLAPAVGTEGGTEDVPTAPAVVQTEPGPVVGGSPARASISAALVSIQALLDELDSPSTLDVDDHREAAQAAVDTITDLTMRDTPPSTWLPGESDGTR